MKSAQQQLSSYKSLHLNATNVKTHVMGIPLIVSAVVLFLSLISIPLPISTPPYTLPVVYVLIVLSMIYYCLLHWKIAIGLLFFFVTCTYLAQLIAPYEFAWLVAMVAFVAGWVLQFIGHHFEKAKPAFVDDINQLMIGPFFLMAELYFLLGLEKPLEQQVTAMAITKRRLFDEPQA